MFKGMPDLLHKRSAPFTQVTIKFPEVIWSLWPGVTACSESLTSHDIPKHPSLVQKHSDTKQAVTQAMDQFMVSGIKTEKKNFGTFFLQIDLDTHFIFRRSIT